MPETDENKGESKEPSGLKACGIASLIGCGFTNIIVLAAVYYIVVLKLCGGIGTMGWKQSLSGSELGLK